MESRPFRNSADRSAKRRSHARPDRIIEKRAKWQDYLDPEEDPGLLGEEEPPELAADETNETAEDEVIDMQDHESDEERSGKEDSR